MEGSHLCFCLREKEDNFFSLGKDEPSWTDMLCSNLLVILFRSGPRFACVCLFISGSNFGKFDLVTS